MNCQPTINSTEGVSPAGDASFAVIVAAGSGRRAGGGLPKQFRTLAGAPVFIHAVRAFLRNDRNTRIIVVVHPDYRELAASALAAEAEQTPISYDIVDGGSTRTESVAAGIAAIPEGEQGLVAVHDGARPLVSCRMIQSGCDAARESGAAVAAIAVTDSLRKLDGGGGSHAVDRSCYVAVQTPQVFRLDVLRKAYALALSDKDAVFTDDASVAEAAGYRVALFDGEHSNIKITTPADFAIAETLLAERQ